VTIENEAGEINYGILETALFNKNSNNSPMKPASLFYVLYIIQ